MSSKSFRHSVAAVLITALVATVFPIPAGALPLAPAPLVTAGALVPANASIPGLLVAVWQLVSAVKWGGPTAPAPAGPGTETQGGAYLPAGPDLVPDGRS